MIPLKFYRNILIILTITIIAAIINEIKIDKEAALYSYSSKNIEMKTEANNE